MLLCPKSGSANTPSARLLPELGGNSRPKKSPSRALSRFDQLSARKPHHLIGKQTDRKEFFVACFRKKSLLLLLRRSPLKTVSCCLVFRGAASKARNSAKVYLWQRKKGKSIPLILS
jgi:hypothetical protein